MNSFEGIVNILIKRQELEIDDLNLIYLENSDRKIAELSGENTDSDEEKYLVIDFENVKSNNVFDLYELFIAKFEKEDEENYIIAVMAFLNRKQEKEIYNNLYDNLSVAAERKKLKNIFDRKISIYLDISETIELEYFNSVNYLENEVDMIDGRLQGNVYNICLYELNKLFNITGEDLFGKNVRLKIKSSPIAYKLKNNFKSYILVYLYKELSKKESIKENELIELKELCILNENELKYNCPEIFWFCHNGITIFSYDEEDIVVLGNKIRLNPQKISVINGAQTLTNFFDCLEEIKRKIFSELKEVFGKCPFKKEEIYNILDDSAKKIIVKTIIIKGPEQYVSPITYGLNTQIPVKNEDILSNSDDIKTLNDYFKYGQIEILRPGQDSIYKYGCDVLDYVKKYEMCLGKPGDSKNFNKKNLKNTIEDSVEFVEKNKNDMIQKMTYLFEIDDWWKSSKKEREEIIDPNDEIESCLTKYGKNYFCSYYLNEQNQKYYYDDFLNSFTNFVYDMKHIAQESGIEVDSNTFKKNTFFNMYKEYKKNEIFLANAKEDDVKIIKKDLDDLKEYLNKVVMTSDKKSVHRMSSDISKYFETNNINLRHFRIIKTDNKKCREAFPFSSSVFSEIYMMEDDSLRTHEYKKYRDSSFCNQVESSFPLFVLDYERNIIKKIYFNNNFSFKKYSSQAEFIYDKTIEAFKKGDESLFPKMGDDKDFHVRPKAKNADDTFEFTNGNQITKRTFWANKKLINTIVEAIDNDSNEWLASD